jgi:hypothetical protein
LTILRASRFSSAHILRVRFRHMGEKRFSSIHS